MLIAAIELGLRQRTPSMCQIPTYLTQVATGLEKGLSIGVDLGGTNLRVCSVELHGDSTSDILHTQVRIPPELMVAKASHDLFSFIARQIQDFLVKFHLAFIQDAKSDAHDQYFALGFTFSFPVYQSAINSGVLLNWTKGFDIPDTINQDVCQLLQREIDLLELPVRVTALVNDAAGTIISRAYGLPLSRTRPTIGAIFGTGTNGVYLESLSEITKTIDGDYDRSTGKMFMSTEWGSFDNKLSVLPVTPYDTELNEHSVNPGNQMFEKRVSGMFLGELLRLAVLQVYYDDGLGLFRDDTGKSNTDDFNRGAPLHTRWKVDSSILSVAEADNSELLPALREKIHVSFGVPRDSVSVRDAQVVKIIAHAIGTRAARLAGMAVGSVIVQSQLLDETHHVAAGLEATRETIVDVAVDGSVVEHYPGFEQYMRESLRALEQIGVEKESRISIGHAKDGSSVGAAIIALLAAEQVVPNSTHL
ncbi:glucokinase [Hypoxylon rubiginosum]|uniref:Glucokinase n=1 Tax=Hypoxylon rubiginosum TaxID=110542 RepID=A0ACC0CMC3_9PEZI|nr:glucokinase [Hypoxylon rubiginosum]